MLDHAIKFFFLINFGNHLWTVIRVYGILQPSFKLANTNSNCFALLEGICGIYSLYILFFKPTIYTTIFKHELITERFADSLRTLLRNPSIDDRKMCLRELLAKLVDGNQKRALINIDYSSMENQVNFPENYIFNHSFAALNNSGINYTLVDHHTRRRRLSFT